MNVKLLKSWLVGQDENMEVVVKVHDHHYIRASASVEDAVKEDRHHYTEWYDGEPGTPVKVLVFYA